MEATQLEQEIAKELQELGAEDVGDVSDLLVGSDDLEIDDDEADEEGEDDC